MGLAISIVGIAASIAFIPATGPIGVAAAISLGSSAAGAALAGGLCMSDAIQ